MITDNSQGSNLSNPFNYTLRILPYLNNIVVTANEPINVI